MSVSTQKPDAVEELPLTPPEPVPFQLIADSAGMKQLLAALETVDRVAVDTEADSLHCYQEKLCLIQVSHKGDSGLHHWLVDPLALDDLNPLLDLLETKMVLMHGASYDLKMLQVGRSFRPQRIFDTEWAAKLLGLKQFGLANLVASELGVALSKQHQKADWGKRPLPDAMQAYAVNDTRFLPTLTERFESRLAELGRLSWLEACCRRMLEVAHRNDEASEADERWRINGSGKLKPPQLERLRRAWLWRDELAERLDRPPFRVAGNEMLLDVALHGREAAVLTGQRKFPARWKASLRRSVEEAEKVPESDCPQRPRSRRGPLIPDWEAKYDHLRMCREKAAQSLGIEAGVLAPRKALERLAAGHPPDENLMEWQIEVLRQHGATLGDSQGSI